MLTVLCHLSSLVDMSVHEAMTLSLFLPLDTESQSPRGHWCLVALKTAFEAGVLPPELGLKVVSGNFKFVNWGILVSFHQAELSSCQSV